MNFLYSLRSLCEEGLGSICPADHWGCFLDEGHVIRHAKKALQPPPIEGWNYPSTFATIDVPPAVRNGADVEGAIAALMVYSSVQAHGSLPSVSYMDGDSFHWKRLPGVSYWALHPKLWETFSPMFRKHFAVRMRVILSETLPRDLWLATDERPGILLYKDAYAPYPVGVGVRYGKLVSAVKVTPSP